MRIAYTHVHSWPDVRRGGERYLHELASAMARRGHDVTIWTTSATSPGHAVEEGVTVERLRRSSRNAARAEQWFGVRVLPTLLRHRYDVVHSLLPSDASAAVVARRLHRGGPCVYTNLGIPDRALWDRRPDRRLHEFVVRYTDVYGCLSEAAAEALRRTFHRDPVITPGGVRLERFPVTTGRATPPTLLYSGTFDDPMKDLGLLLRAVAELASRRPDLRLLMTGPGDPSAHLRAAPEAARARTEVLPLATPDLAAVYGTAWVTVLPSKWESFALALVESLACGTPVVATRHGASPERVVDGTGYLCEPDDLDSLVDACDRALDLTSDPGIAARCRAAAEPWDWDTLAPKYERIYRDAARRS
jgi:phosphatidylinositol alpha-mannosyltransferase